MSFFTTTANLYHTTPLPSGTTFESALEKLQNHDLLIRLDPELAHYEDLPPRPSSDDKDASCSTGSSGPNSNTKRYKVTDHMHTLPKGLWDTTVTFESEITNTLEGVEWIIRAPLGLVQRTIWRIVSTTDLEKGKNKMVEDEQDRSDGEAKGTTSRWVLVEEVEIKASRLLVGTVRGKCEENWRGIHGKFIGHLKGEEIKA